MSTGIPKKFEKAITPNGHAGHLSLVFNRTDLGNAERLVHRHGKNLRYSHPWKKWLVYDGTRWKVDDTGEIERLAKETVSAMFHEADPGGGKPIDKDLVKHALSSQSAARIGNMIALARSEPGIPVMPNELDADPWLLNCQNGTVDLRTGELKEHRREDLITKLVQVEYEPDAEASRFERFLREVLVDDEVIAFVRRFAGYSLTGSTRERVVAILHGRGKNGKSTLVELFHDVLGDYATTTATETLLTKRYEGIGNDVAALKGARFVAAAEIEKGRRLAESKVKQLTGNDTVTARFLYGEPFSFRPEFKLWLSTNNRPEIHGTDDAIWDRIRLIPFDQRFEGKKADHKLPERLRAEMPGVLAWMVRGCSEWLLEGLGEPKRVKDATTEYRNEQDILGAFLADRCVEHEDAWALATPLYKEYEQWCEQNGEPHLSQTKFGRNLSERGFEQKRQSGSRLWMRRGIGLLDPQGANDTGVPLGAES